MEQLIHCLNFGGSVDLPNNIFNNLAFNNSNLMLFINTAYLEQSRYKISNSGRVTFTNPNDTGVLIPGKMVTGILLEGKKTDGLLDEDDLSHSKNSYLSIIDDDTFIWFDEQITKVHK